MRSYAIFRPEVSNRKKYQVIGGAREKQSTKYRGLI